MGTILIGAGICGVVLLVLSVLWPKLRSVVPAPAQAIGDKVETAVDKATAAAALETLVLLFNERGDTETVATLGKLWTDVWAWQPPATAAATPTVEQLAAQVAQLKTQATGQ